jgi:hypothetical protein
MTGIATTVMTMTGIAVLVLEFISLAPRSLVLESIRLAPRSLVLESISLAPRGLVLEFISLVPRGLATIGKGLPRASGMAMIVGLITAATTTVTATGMAAGDNNQPS